MKRLRLSGFTLVELTIAIAVIGILATISVVSYNGVQERTRDARRKSDLATIIEGLDLYYNKHGKYPPGSCTLTPSTACKINTGWSTTAESNSWSNLAAHLEPFIDTLPYDPVNTQNINILLSSNKGYAYAYFSNNSSVTSYCGAAQNQMYILVYRLEGSAQENTDDGDCPTMPVGPYSGASNYRRIR